MDDPLPRDPGLRILLGGLSFGTLLAALDQSVVGPALPAIATELGGLDRLPWVVSAYLLGSAMSIPVFAKISDSVGRRGPYQVAVVVFTAGSLLSAVAGSMWQLVAARAVQGVGGGALMSLTHAIIGDAVAPRERGRYLVWISSVWGAATVAGPLLGGVLTDHVSWRAIFMVNAPLGIAVLLSTHRVLPGVRPGTGNRVSVRGLLLLTLAVGGLMATLLQIDGARPPPSGAWVALCATVVLLAAFVVGERRSPSPVFPARVLRDATFRVAGVGGAFHGVSIFCAVAFLPLHLQAVRSTSATGTGFLLLPFMGSLLIVMTLVGRSLSRTGRYRRFPITGTVLVGSGYALLGSGIASGTGLGDVLPLVLVGAGLGMVMQVLLIAAQNEADPDDIGIVTGALTFVRQLAGSLGTAVLGTAYAVGVTRALGPAAFAALEGDAGSGGLTVGDPQVAAAVEQSLRVVWWSMVPLAAVTCVVVAWFLVERPLRRTVTTEPEI